MLLADRYIAIVNNMQTDDVVMVDATNGTVYSTISSVACSPPSMYNTLSLAVLPAENPVLYVSGQGQDGYPYMACAYIIATGSQAWMFRWSSSITSTSTFLHRRTICCSVRTPVGTAACCSRYLCDGHGLPICPQMMGSVLSRCFSIHVSMSVHAGACGGGRVHVFIARR
jgi:hypothetical protein